MTINIIDTGEVPVLEEKKLPTWKVFWDVQCPYSKRNWEILPAIRERFKDEYEFEIHLSSLLFHSQAFTAQCAANLIAARKGPEAKQKFIDACFSNQDRFTNAVIGDARKSEVDKVFATIAKEAGLLDDDDFSESTFLAKLHDWQESVLPTWNEHKVALGYGVVGVPRCVIDGELIEGTDSSWGPDEWAEKLKNKRKRERSINH